MLDSFRTVQVETSAKLLRLTELEDTQKALERRIAIESTTKEAVYALDMRHPMSLFDCLIPELEAYRPIKPRLRPKWTYEENVVASTKLNKLKWKLEKSKVP